LTVGTVRLVVAPGKEPQWKQYKAVHLDPVKVRGAWLDNNPALLEWLNDQSFSAVVTCLGDGHDGIWNLFDQMQGAVERREILDWYHLMENLEKVGGSLKRLAQARSLLWQGKVDETLALFETCQHHQAHCFCQYLRKHRHRIVNYAYLQAEGIARLAREPLNQRLNKLIVGSSFQGHDGSRNMFQTF